MFLTVFNIVEKNLRIQFVCPSGRIRIRVILLELRYNFYILKRFIIELSLNNVKRVQLLVRRIIYRDTQKYILILWFMGKKFLRCILFKLLSKISHFIAWNDDMCLQYCVRIPMCFLIYAWCRIFCSCFIITVAVVHKLCIRSNPFSIKF